MSVTLRVLASASSGWEPDVPTYIEWGDVDAMGGWGVAELTTDPAKAMRFPDAARALTYWRRQSTVAPLRADGHPNRPLTAYTVEIAEAP